MKLRLAGLCSALALLAACDFTPKGATVFKVAGSKEYDRAQITYPRGEGVQQQPLKLRWADSNTWLTTATFSQGKYTFTARTYDGGYYSREIELKPGQNRYEMAEQGQTVFESSAGPKVSGAISNLPQNFSTTELAVIFIGNDVTVRRVPLRNAMFTAEAPIKGSFRVEVHLPGNPPRSYSTGPIQLNSDTNLGRIELK